METHVECFGAFLSDVGVEYTMCRGVIDFDRSGWLFVTESIECIANGDGGLGVNVGGGGF